MCGFLGCLVVSSLFKWWIICSWFAGCVGCSGEFGFGFGF